MSLQVKWVKIYLKSCIQNKKDPQCASGRASSGKNATADGSPQPFRNRHLVSMGHLKVMGRVGVRAEV